MLLRLDGNQLERLITRFIAWDEALSALGMEQTRGLPAEHRGRLLAELRELTDRSSRKPPPRHATTWGRVAALFDSPRGSAPDACERALLDAYERTCELAPPTSVLNTLLRHYSSIKRASLRQDARSMPAPQVQPSASELADLGLQATAR